MKKRRPRATGWSTWVLPGRRFQQFASKHGADNQRRFDLQLLTHHLARGVDGLVDFIVAVRS